MSDMKTSAPGLLPLFRSETQLEVLGLLYSGPARSWTVGEIARQLHLGLPTVSREVNRLAEAGILRVQAVGRTRVVSANWELSWAEPLAQLLDRTIGPLARLSEALSEMPEVNSAWVYGSWAERYHGKVGMAPRDIDVLVVGDDIDVVRLTIITDRLSDRIAMPVNPTPVTTSVWERPERGSFVEQVKNSPVVSIPLVTDA
jgi:DNA-binding Lrp family transcriptional regulator